eukprot:9268494-Pyramimonas_sp.AAC.1
MLATRHQNASDSDPHRDEASLWVRCPDARCAWRPTFVDCSAQESNARPVGLAKSLGPSRRAHR